MHVLHVISSLGVEFGGPGLALMGLAQAQHENATRVSIVTTKSATEKGSSAEELRTSGVSVDVVGPCKTALMRHRDLVPTLESAVASADIVHVHALWEEIQYQASRIARISGVPYVIRPCGMLDPWSLSQSKFKKRAYYAWRLRGMLDNASAVHFTTEIERDLARWWVHPNSRAIVEPNGIDTSEFEPLPPRGAFRDRRPAIGGRRIVLFLGRIHPKKGLELLLRAFARLRPQNCVLVVAGPDNIGYEARLRDLAIELSIADQVDFAGIQMEKERIEAFVDADLFVLPSHQENFGNTVIESLAAGTPVLISDQVNLHVQVTRAKVGDVHEMSVASLTEKLELALQRDNGWCELTRRARQFAFDQFDWRNISDRWNGHYHELTTAPSATEVG